VERFTIAVPQVELDDLRARLARTRFPDQLRGSGWEPGTDLAYLRELCAYWERGFDWRRVEAQLNGFDQFLVQIDGQPLHFVHQRAQRSRALPLLLLHGWPSTFAEFARLIPPLAAPAAGEPAFHVIVPSLPGYGFSGPTLEPGWTPQRMAAAFAELMSGLGYRRFGVHGGDWGASIGSELARAFPERVVGLHLSMVFPIRPRVSDPLEGLSPAEQSALDRMYADGQRESGYQHLQSTRPQSLAPGLNDSPAGLAAWIAEKFRAWSDCGGNLEAAFTRDELLTCISIYWFTQTIHSSMRLYFESQRTGRRGSGPAARIPVPMGHARFPGDAFRTPRRWAEHLYDVRRWTELPRGGHFPALEVPDLLLAELRAFFADCGP
jgi:microsomal epoxide hydrolase